MWPWFWFLTPNTYFPWHGNINFPLSGSVMQDLSQSWFGQHIKMFDAGEPIQEERIFDIASYGKQLGVITDILLGLIKSEGILLEGDAQRALTQLEDIHKKVEQIKDIYGDPEKRKKAKAAKAAAETKNTPD